MAVIAMKLGMYLMCRGSSDPSVRAFALDHINDVVVNSVGLAGEASILRWYTRMQPGRRQGTACHAVARASDCWHTPQCSQHHSSAGSARGSSSLQR